MVETTILKVIPIVVICIGLIVGGFVYFSNVNDSKEEIMEEQVYQGPVRPTDNEAHFRLTGETIPLEVEA